METEPAEVGAEEDSRRYVTSTIERRFVVGPCVALRRSVLRHRQTRIVTSWPKRPVIQGAGSCTIWDDGTLRPERPGEWGGLLRRDERRGSAAGDAGVEATGQFGGRSVSQSTS